MDIYMEWQSLLTKAGGSSWPDDAKKISLDRILNNELAQALVTAPSARSFKEYCGTLKEINDKIRAFKATRPTRRAATQYTANQLSNNKRGLGQVQKVPSPKNDQGDEMDWELSQPTKSASAKRAKWVTQEERDERRRNGLCLQCGASGHRIASCIYAPPRRPNRTVALASQSTPQPHKPVLEEEKWTVNSDLGLELGSEN